MVRGDRTLNPAVSVIVPTRNRPASLAALLEALERQRPIAGGFEVVVVDDGSDPPVEARGQLAQHDDLRVSSLRLEGQGPSAARNAGAGVAAGSLLVFTDDDCLPRDDWLVNLCEAHRSRPDAVIGGRSVCGLPGNRWAESSQALEDVVYRRANADHQHARFFASKNVAVPRSAFLRHGGFDSGFRYSEDRELCARLIDSGERLVYCPGAVVAHMNPRDRRVFFRQHFGYGKGARRFHRRHGRGGRLQVDPADYAAFASEAFTGPKRQGISRPTVFLLIVASQLASALGYLFQAAKDLSPRARRRAGR